MADAPLTTTQAPAMAMLDWLLTGASEQQIHEALSQRYPNVDPGHAMQQVQAHLVAAGQPHPDAINGWCLMAYRSLYQKMLAVGDLDGCRKVVKEIQLLGAGR